MVLIGLGALLVLGGILYTARSAIWRGRLAAGIHLGLFAAPWSRHGAAWDSWGLERTGRAFSLWQSVQFCWWRGPVSSPSSRRSNPGSCCGVACPMNKP
jgi:hypothetical protein